MKRSFWLLQSALLLVIGVALCSGCGSSSGPTANNPPSPQPPPAPVPVMPAPSPLPMTDSQPLPPTVTPTPPIPPPTETPLPNPLQPPSPAPAIPPALPEPPATPADTVKAGVGTGQAGRSLDNLDPVQNVVAYPAKAFFAAREKIKFQIEIPGAYKLYKAENETPLTLDEFKQKVLDPNGIKLPPLPPGHTYEWDPEKEELMVRQPKK